MEILTRCEEWYQRHRERIEQDYFHFLRFPSISADPSKKKEILDCAHWLSMQFTKAKCFSELINTPSGIPIVYGEAKSPFKEAKTLLIYGHYDVQPVDPLSLWISPPFEPTIREGKVFARGALDDKGQIFYACTALFSLLDLGIPLPVNVKFCIEGEEETASKGLSQSLPFLKEKLAADSLLVVDFDSGEDGSPAISLGARGLISLELTLQGSKGDLHSGVYGGLAYNPNRALAEMINALWDEKGNVAVEGFYEGLVLPSKEELLDYRYTVSEERLEKECGIKAIPRQAGASLMEKNWFFPTIEINGMWGGYTGEGVKTVIPSRAHAKITCRLGVGQNPKRVSENVASFLQKKAPAGMQLEIRSQGGMKAFRGNPKSRLAQTVRFVSEKVVQKSSIAMLSGGSIPIVAEMIEHLGVDVVGMGYGLSTDQIHAPNEHFDLKRFFQGFLTVAGVIAQC